ncbi:hypothetical protein M431DRAFT_484923 [Trichoderma harzianum CBS 226.95]|uniref:Uncharacterized protein n=1 Tax=Trichoderma harzianum CBS 226.95 TaxID=983964 RepID=A0A2T4A216_TRIHA|nr:hypothetical protein M431DRAFT_484923 [Trichoderma harzianum CBS 226.95]PTB51013.1 hypothetical protein M431DRAFT_484923 [Trichoderma harzianum CBS 226.95]
MTTARLIAAINKDQDEQNDKFENKEEVLREWKQNEAIRQYNEDLPDTAPPTQYDPCEGITQEEINDLEKPDWEQHEDRYGIQGIIEENKRYDEIHEDHGAAECGQQEFTLCNKDRYKKHQYQRRALACVTHNLEQQGFNLMKHGNDDELRGINWNDLRKYHKLTTRHVPKPGCTWCERYNVRNKEPGWITSDLDNIDIDPYGNNYYDGADDATYYNLNTLTGGKKLRKFQVPGTLEGHPITVYIDSGATTSYITP